MRLFKIECEIFLKQVCSFFEIPISMASIIIFLLLITLKWLLLRIPNYYLYVNFFSTSFVILGGIGLHYKKKNPNKARIHTFFNPLASDLHTYFSLRKFIWGFLLVLFFLCPNTIHIDTIRVFLFYLSSLMLVTVINSLFACYLNRAQYEILNGLLRVSYWILLSQTTSDAFKLDHWNSIRNSSVPLMLFVIITLVCFNTLLLKKIYLKNINY